MDLFGRRTGREGCPKQKVRVKMPHALDVELRRDLTPADVARVLQELRVDVVFVKVGVRA